MSEATAVAEIQGLVQKAQQREIADLARDLGLPGTFGGIRGWKMMSYEDVYKWISQKCKNCLAVNSSTHVRTHLFGLSEYPAALPYGVMLTLKDALDHGLQRQRFFVCDPKYSQPVVDPLLLYCLTQTKSEDVYHITDRFLLACEWERVAEPADLDKD